MTQQSNGLDIGQIYEQETTRPPSIGLGLKYNPFPPTGITGSGDSLGPFYLAPAYRNQLNEFVRRAVRQDDFCGLVVIGEYGAGKTALLKYFETRVSAAREQGYPLAAYYVPNPGTSFSDVLQSMTRAIEREILQKYGWAFVFFNLREGVKQSDAYLEDIGLVSISNDRLTQISDSHEFWRLFHDELGVDSNVLATAVTRVMLETLPDDMLAHDLSGIMLGDRSTAAQTWTKLTRPISPTSTKKPVPRDRLESLLMVLKANGINHVFLLIDEFEDVVFHRMSKRLRDDFTATLRLLVAEHGRDLSIVFASNIPGWNLLIRSDPGLSERFNFQIELGELFGGDLSGVVQSYIRRAKMPESDAADQFFSDATLSLVEERSITLARPLLAILHRLTDRFWEVPELPSSAEIKSYLYGE